jgi:hypothetical protein
MQQIKQEIIGCVRQAISKIDSDPFEALNGVFMSHFEKPATNITELKRNTTKQKGTVWEVFCKMWLEARGYHDVWLLAECPHEIIKYLNLHTFDVGIDLIARIKIPNTAGENFDDFFWVAVQAKYRSPTRDKMGRAVHKVGWRDLSTFIALTGRSGPPKGWLHKVVMTNADSVCWRGTKTSDSGFKTYAKGTFKKGTREEWLKLIGGEGQKLESVAAPPQPDVKAARAAWLDKIAQKV